MVHSDQKGSTGKHLQHSLGKAACSAFSALRIIADYVVMVSSTLYGGRRQQMRGQTLKNGGKEGNRRSTELRRGSVATTTAERKERGCLCTYPQR